MPDYFLNIAGRHGSRRDFKVGSSDQTQIVDAAKDTALRPGFETATSLARLLSQAAQLGVSDVDLEESVSIGQRIGQELLGNKGLSDAQATRLVIR